MKTLKRYLFATLTGLLFSVASNAQDDFEQWKNQQKKEFDTYSEQQEKAFNDYRDQANAEFARFIRQSWESFQSFQGIPIPKQPKPVVPPKADPNKAPTIDPIPFKEISPAPKPFEQPKPFVPIPARPADQPQGAETPPSKSQFTFSFYNTPCKVSIDASHRFSLRDATENSVADAWKTLSNSRYNDLLNDCLALRETLNLCDWGYMELLKTLSERFFGKPCNEAVVLQMFILAQSGYKVRLARAGERLVLLVPFLQTFYEYAYISINGLKYFILDKSLKGQQFYVLNHEFPKEQSASLQLSQPNFPPALTPAKTFASRLFSNLSVNVSTNQNLIDFYNHYPVSAEWNLYTLASLSETVKSTLYPALQHIIAGKSEKEAANIFLHFVQTAFEYKTDEEQFGYERPLFGDESFFYPYNDCEDRSILYATLVKELLHLDVVLLHYPEHLATAVCFREKVEGDYLSINGKTYIVCDPTYIGADIGWTMSQFKTTKVGIVKL